MGIQVLPSVTALSTRDWDCLRQPRTLYETPGWLASTELTMPGKPLVTAESGPGGLASVVIWRAVESDDPSPYFNIGALLARLTSRPALPAGGWTLNCVGTEMFSPALIASDLRFDGPQLRAHIDAAIGTRDTPPVLCGVNFLPRDPAPGLPESLAALGFDELRGYQQALLELPGDSFDDYLAGLSGRQRTDVRRDRRRFAETGQRTSVTRGRAAAGEDIIQLHRNNRLKYGRPDDVADLQAYHDALFGCCDEDTVVARSYRGTTCTGFGMFVRSGPTMHAMATGSQKHDDRISPYFECLFYAPIEWAYQNGVREIDYGIGASATKSQRGCRIVDVATWYRAG